MKRLINLTLSAAALLLLGLALSAGEARAQESKLKAQAVGHWTLVSSVIEQGDTKVEPFGPNPIGGMVLDANGRFFITLTRADRPKFASNNRETGTDAENKAAVQGSIGYYGTYSINEADGTFTAHIEGSTYPNWVGTEQKRLIQVAGDQLTYVSNSPSGGTGTARVVWKRAK